MCGGNYQVDLNFPVPLTVYTEVGDETVGHHSQYHYYLLSDSEFISGHPINHLGNKNGCGFNFLTRGMISVLFK